VRSGGEHRHVHPDLGDHALGGPLGHPGDGVEAVPSLREGASTRSLWVSSSAIDAQVLQVRKGQAHQQGVVVPEPSAPQRLAQLGELGPQPPPGQLSQHLGVAFPGHQGGQHRPARGAQHVGGDRVQLDPGVSRVFWTRWPSAAWAWMSRLR
jgi:hypothetical protein